MFFFLFLITELQQCRAKHGDAEAIQRAARADSRHFFPQDFHLILIQAAAAVLSGPMRHGPAALGHTVTPDFLVGMIDLRIAATVVQVIKAFNGDTHSFGAIFLQPGTRFLAELVEITHGKSSLKWCGAAIEPCHVSRVIVG